MWGVLVILLSGSFGSASLETNIRVHCKETKDNVPESLELAPSLLVDLRGSATEDSGVYLLNISWAVALDSTTKHVKGVFIDTIQGKHKCEYSPPLSKVHFPETQETLIWFHHTIDMLPAPFYFIKASNIPLRPFESGSPFIHTIVYPPKQTDPTPKRQSTVPSNITTAAPPGSKLAVEHIVCVALIVCSTLLVFGYVIYKLCGARLARDYKKVCPALSGPAVPVLVLYPAESAQFQWAVGALAEFLQQQGKCSVAVDMWQQGSVAKLGPMRWLLEQVQAAHRVLIVAAQPSPQTLPIPRASISATAQDLYALALNLVAGQAKNSTDLAKFWVIRFGESALPASELRACRRFSLMKDLNKLCRCLHQHKQGGSTKIVDLILRSNYCNGDSAEKLRAAVQALNGQQGSVTKGQEVV